MHGIAPLSFRLLSIRVLISIAQIVTLSSPNPFTLTPTEKKEHIYHEMNTKSIENARYFLLPNRYLTQITRFFYGFIL